MATASGTQEFVVDWIVDYHELSSDGSQLLVRGDQGMRAVVWDLGTGARLHELAGDLSRRGSLRANLVSLAGVRTSFATSYTRRTALVVHSLDDNRELGWFSAFGMIAFAVERAATLSGSWVSVLGHGDSDQDDTVSAFDAGSLDTEAMQMALRERPSVIERGFRVAIGPAGTAGAVVYRDAEWEPDDIPDDPGEAFQGLEIWDLPTATIVQRIALAAAVPTGANIGATADHVAIEMETHVELITRAAGERRSIAASVLDPYRMEIARIIDGAIVIETL